MKASERGWVRGAVVIGIAGTMMAAALFSPALAGKLATKKYVNNKVNGLQSQINQVQSQANAAQTAANAAQTAANAATAAATAGQTQTFIRSAPIPVGAGSFAAGEVNCPAGMVVNGGGVAASGPALFVVDSVPTDGTGQFTATFGVAGGAGFVGWGAIVASTAGAGSYRIYATCRTGTQSGSNYATGNPATRSTGGF